jgi:hypothetical protein
MIASFCDSYLIFDRITSERGVIGIVSECDVLSHFGKHIWELLKAEEIMTPPLCGGYQAGNYT